MTRPEIVRADTIDLQDPNTPSAKDHSRQPASPKPLGDGPPAPHQAQSLRKASLDGYDLHVRSPRASKDLSDKELQLLHDIEPDEQDVADEQEQVQIQEAAHDVGVEDEDDDLDDDLMDKISSSPSIDDGSYLLQASWPRRKDSLLQLPLIRERDEACRRDTAHISQPSRPQNWWTGVYRGKQGENGHAMQVRSHVHKAPRLEVKRKDPGQRSRFKEDFPAGSARGHVEELPLHSLQDEATLSPAIDANVPPLDVEFDTGSSIYYGSKALHVSDVESEASWREDDDRSCFDEMTSDPVLAQDLWNDERYIDSGWGGECLREVEDIDFEFVYALHTFVATVEGQANATKGDTMVLLDDSNSYWWLVKVVKDSSIGYLPAEHIETPTERLARLNKHRNIDLSQTMLGDNPAKSTNPLKKAMRRRNAKTVQFAEPQYFEPSDHEHSSDEEDGEPSPAVQAAQAAQAQSQSETQAHQQQQAADDSAATGTSKRTKDGASSLEERATVKSQDDQEKLGPGQDAQDRDDEVNGRRRMRNTDSFYKDETVETRKISLTPHLLKEDGSSASPTLTQTESRSSLDSQKSVEKSPAGSDKSKEKKKEKKGGVLGGLFKRRPSKGKQDKDIEKEDLLVRSSPQPLNLADSASVESSILSPVSVTSPAANQTKHGKLHKAPPQAKSSSSKRTAPAEEPTAQKSARSEPVTATEPTRALSPTSRSKQAENAGPALLAQQLHSGPPSQGPDSQEETKATESNSPSQTKPHTFLAPIHTMLTGSSGNEVKEHKPEKVKKAKNRMALDDSETSDDDTPNDASLSSQKGLVENLPDQLKPIPQPVDTTRSEAKAERLSESPIEVSPVRLGQANHASGSTVDVPPSPVSHNSTPELVERPSESELARAGKGAAAAGGKMAGQHTAYHQADLAATPSGSDISSPLTANEPAGGAAGAGQQWSSAALRAYLDADGAHDVRDLMLLVHDTSAVKALPESHELVRAFNGERRRLEGMQRRLDNLLGEVLSRRSAAPAA